MQTLEAIAKRKSTRDFDPDNHCFRVGETDGGADEGHGV